MKNGRLVGEFLSTGTDSGVTLYDCKGKGKRVLTQIELEYGIKVSEPVCKPKNGKRKFQVPRVTGDNERVFVT